jgi:hypothetical protein
VTERLEAAYRDLRWADVRAYPPMTILSSIGLARCSNWRAEYAVVSAYLWGHLANMLQGTPVPI